MAAVESSHWWYVGMREIGQALITPYVEGSGPRRILDIGCGTGGNLLWLRDLGEARGVDASPICVDYCRRKGLQVELGSMTRLPVPPASQDLVTMFDVMNQADATESPAILAGAARALAPGALLALREPAMPIAAGAHDRATNVRFRLVASQVRDLLQGAGLEPLRVTYVNSLLFAPIVLRRRLEDLLYPGRAASDLKPSSGPINAGLLAVMRTERWLLERLNMPCGVSVFALARKPGAAEGR